MSPHPGDPLYHISIIRNLKNFMLSSHSWTRRIRLYEYAFNEKHSPSYSLCSDVS